MKLSYFSSLILLALITSLCQPKTPPKRKLDQVIFDSAKILKPGQAEALYNSITSVENEFGSQLAIVIVGSLRGKTIEKYSIQVAEGLKLASGKNRDGLLMTLALEEGKGRIEVGYGL